MALPNSTVVGSFTGDFSQADITSKTLEENWTWRLQKDGSFNTAEGDWVFVRLYVRDYKPTNGIRGFDPSVFSITAGTLVSDWRVVGYFPIGSSVDSDVVPEAVVWYAGKVHGNLGTLTVTPLKRDAFKKPEITDYLLEQPRYTWLNQEAPQAWVVRNAKGIAIIGRDYAEWYYKDFSSSLEPGDESIGTGNLALVSYPEVRGIVSETADIREEIVYKAEKYNYSSYDTKATTYNPTSFAYAHRRTTDLFTDITTTKTQGIPGMASFFGAANTVISSRPVITTTSYTLYPDDAKFYLAWEQNVGLNDVTNGYYMMIERTNVTGFTEKPEYYNPDTNSWTPYYKWFKTKENGIYLPASSVYNNSSSTEFKVYTYLGPQEPSTQFNKSSKNTMIVSRYGLANTNSNVSIKSVNEEFILYDTDRELYNALSTESNIVTPWTSSSSYSYLMNNVRLIKGTSVTFVATGDVIQMEAKVYFAGDDYSRSYVDSNGVSRVSTTEWDAFSSYYGLDDRELNEALYLKKDFKVDGNKITVDGLRNKKPVIVSVRAKNSMGYWSNWNTVPYVPSFEGLPEITISGEPVTSSSGMTGVGMFIDNPNNVTYDYLEVERRSSSNDKWGRLGISQSTSFSDFLLSADKSYQYRARVVRNATSENGYKTYSPWAYTTQAITVPSNKYGWLFKVSDPDSAVVFKERTREPREYEMNSKAVDVLGSKYKFVTNGSGMKYSTGHATIKTYTLEELDNVMSNLGSGELLGWRGMDLVKRGSMDKITEDIRFIRVVGKAKVSFMNNFPDTYRVIEFDFEEQPPPGEGYM